MLQQTRAPDELLVGDDAADAAEVVAAIGDRRVRYIARPERLGLAGNLNSLCDEATGDLLTVLMDDDRWDERFLATCMPRFDDEEVGVVFTDHFIEEAGVVKRRNMALAGGRHRGFGERIAHLNPVAISAAVFRSAAWRDVRPLPETSAMDFVLWARIAEAGWAFDYVDEPLMTYAAGGISTHSSFSNDVIAAYESVAFESPDAERLRRKRLGDAYLSRASRRIEAGALSEARLDIAKGEAAHAGRTFRSRLLRVAGRNAVLARASRRAASMTRWKPWP